MGTRRVDIETESWVEIFPPNKGGFITNEGGDRARFFVSSEKPDDKVDIGHTVNSGCHFTHKGRDGESLFARAAGKRGTNYIVVTDE